MMTLTEWLTDPSWTAVRGLPETYDGATVLVQVDTGALFRVDMVTELVERA